jgi:hypothetical protein
MEPDSLNLVVNLKSFLQKRPAQTTVSLLDHHYGAGGWVYVGRANDRYGLERSVFANPFSHLAGAQAQHVATREDAIEAFRQWLWQQLQGGNPPVLTALRAIQPDTVLVCWCAPQPCHAEVIARAAAWLRRKELLATAPPANAATTVRVVVCGGRDFRDYAHLEESLDTLLAGLPTAEIISGAAQGTDRLGERYAATRGLMCHRFPADWDRDGRRAGYVRNQQLVDHCDRVVAFWDGQSRGTKHMIEIATAKGIPVDVVRYQRRT